MKHINKQINTIIKNYNLPKEQADYKIKLYNHSRACSQRNVNFTPLKCHYFRGYKIKDQNHSNKTIKQLDRAQRKTRILFMTYDLNAYNCWHAVFTINPKKIELRGKELINFMNKKLEYTIEQIRSKIGKANQLYYFSRLEANKTEGLYHYHVGLFFKNCPSKILTLEYLSNLWSYGYVWISKHQKPWTILGYLTKIRKSDFLDKVYSKYPSWMKVIRHSLNIPKTKDVITVYMNEDGYKELLRALNKKSLLTTGQKLFIYKEYVIFVDYSTGEKCKYTRNVYLY